MRSIANPTPVLVQITTEFQNIYTSAGPTRYMPYSMLVPNPTAAVYLSGPELVIIGQANLEFEICPPPGRIASGIPFSARAPASGPFYPVGLAFALKTPGVPEPNVRLGFKFFPQCDTRFEQSFFYCSTFGREPGYAPSGTVFRFEFSVMIQEASGPTIGIIDPPVCFEMD
jgi:hypothetical protein